MIKKRKIKDKVELEKLIDSYLKNDISLVLLEEECDLTYPQREFLLKKSMAFSRQQEELADEYDRYKLSSDYLEMKHDIKEENPLSAEEQIALFKRMDEIDESNILTRLGSTNDELSRMKTAKRKILTKFSREMYLCDFFRKEFPEESLSELLSKEGIKPNRVDLICETYDSYLELRKRISYLTKCRDELLNDRRNLADESIEYSNIVETLVSTNIKLANWVIREFFKGIPLPKEEVQALAYQGLGAAINRFDYTLGYNFSTYATKVITNTIKRNFKSLMGVTWTTYCMKHNIKYWREQLLSYDETRTKPFTAIELANSGLVRYTARQIEALDKGVDVIYSFSDYYDEIDDSDVESKGIMPCQQSDYDYIDAIEDQEGIIDYSKMIDDEVFIPFLRDTLYEVMGELDERSQKILIERYGLNGEEPKTLEEVGKMFYITGARVREIEAKALRRLRHPVRKDKLIDYADQFDVFKEYPKLATTSDYVKAFDKLYQLRDSRLPNSAKAWFISTRLINWTEGVVENLDYLLDAFIANIYLEDMGYPLDLIIEMFCHYRGGQYKYNYPYNTIYKLLRDKLHEDDEEVFEKKKQEILSNEDNLVVEMTKYDKQQIKIMMKEFNNNEKGF